MERDNEFGGSKCLECGDRFEYGRQDKKFCSDECRNKFNNRRRKATKQAKIKIQQILERNYSILDSLLKMKVRNITIPQLCQMGFNLEYMTSHRKTRRHDEFGCFDINIIVMSGNVISISRAMAPAPVKGIPPHSLTDGY